MMLARFAAALFAATVSLASAQQWPPKPEPLGDDLYQPTLGQAGKDVVWIPTPDALVVRMLTAAGVRKDDVVYDLGSGDGKIPIAAAKQFGARAVGIEYNPDMASLARRNAERAGVKDMVDMVTGDIFVEDFSKATVVTMYLLPELNRRLRPIILRMKPGTRVTSHQFNMGDWPPDEQFEVEGRDAYLWVVPANVGGEWIVRHDNGAEATLSLIQRYQKVGGTITSGGRHHPLLGATLRGDQLAFSYVDGDDNLRTARFLVDGGTMRGELAWWSGAKTNAMARRR